MRRLIDALRAVWDEPRAPDAPRRVWRDWALVGVAGPLAVLEGLLRPDLPMRALSVLVVLAGIVALLPWRRRQPLAAVVVAFGATGLLPLLAGRAMDNAAAIAVLLPVYALTRWGSGREIVLGVSVIAVKAGVMDRLVQVKASDAIAGLAVLSSCLALGLALRYRAGARRREIDRIRLLERERLARDLHDTVAHHVSAMAIRAQAGIATAASDPDAALSALHLIEAEASRALAEMRAMVRLLRHAGPVDRPELTPTPSIADLTHLAGPAGVPGDARPDTTRTDHPRTAEARTGPRVDVELSGDLDTVPAPVGAAVYRLAQESVTNARRHARHATRIAVRVHADDTSVRLRVTDDGDSGPARPATAPGYGLIGMTERATLLGGTCEAGPTHHDGTGRGWTVAAVLPRSVPHRPGRGEDPHGPARDENPHRPAPGEGFEAPGSGAVR
ncbi:sensor histidine kinase [Dactylosporangium sp. NPDC000521]|uniref:sensor histidine kinase n=1 Tax=Dactylosporangium sp. NPDC000521 TaxID=3363975 RepID=UPI0036792621